MLFASAVPLTQLQTGKSHPSRHALVWLTGIVLVVHVLILLGMSGTLDFQLHTQAPASVSPLQTRMITAPAAQAPKPAAAQAPRTRIAKQVAPQQPPEAAPAPQPTETASLPEVIPAPAETTAISPPPAESAASTPPTETAPTAAAPMPEGEPLPNIPLGALPPSGLLSYRLNGQEKGLSYFAGGELSWQHNDQSYALSLSVKAFLLGSRHWRSAGEITSTGLAPRRFSDSWRGERASHFDRQNKRIVFSNNAPEAALLAGAQDQISLYVQLASAMAGSPERFAPGTRLQVQTVTLRDALPWTLTLAQYETLNVNDEALPTAKWDCQPRNRFDAKVEFWVAEKHHWLPVRIRITQVNGNFIDLNLRGHDSLPALPITEKTTSP